NNKFTFWILLSTFIISIGAGHGVAPMVMIQFWTLTNTESETWFYQRSCFLLLN
ncbi:MAG: formate/nitrite transporter FocA (FNT family), partial [Marinoscillum sp.]